jgi:hypothetical protein
VVSIAWWLIGAAQEAGRLNWLIQRGKTPPGQEIG